MSFGGDSSWWGNIIKSAKEKSMSTLEIIKTDFSEFTTIMTNDTTELLNKASAQLIEKRNTASYLLDSFDNKLKIETNNILKTSTNAQERYENELRSIQLDENIYLHDSDSEDFIKWKENFNLDIFKSTMSELLIENSSMRIIYSKLVPARLSNEQFWCRYFFRINIFEEEQRKRIKLLERVKDNSSLITEESIDWEDDTEDNNIANNSITVNANENGNSINIDSKDEVTDLLIKNETAKVLDKITESITENLSISNIELKNETMVASAKTEDSDEWDKLSDSSITEKKKIQEEYKKTTDISNLKKSTLVNEAQTKSNENEWDDWDD